jgi:hypothetical protein
MKLTICLGVTGLTSIKALPYTSDMSLVWDITNGLAEVAVATPQFIDMTELLVNSVPSGTYVVELPSALENENLWIAVYSSGIIPAVSDPIYGSIDYPSSYVTNYLYTLSALMDYGAARVGSEMALTADERIATAAALLDLANGVETGATVREALQRMSAVLAGKVSGSGTGTEIFKGMNSSTTRVAFVVDSKGNRLNVAYGQ